MLVRWIVGAALVVLLAATLTPSRGREMAPGVSGVAPAAVPGLVTRGSNGDLLAGASVVATPGNYRLLTNAGSTLLIALPPGREGLVVYEPVSDVAGTYRERFSATSDALAEATAIMEARPLSAGYALVELHINPSTGLAVRLNLATGVFTATPCFAAAGSPDGTRLATLQGPPHAFPRREFTDLYVDGQRLGHYDGTSSADLAWVNGNTLRVTLRSATTGQRLRTLRVAVPRLPL